jgi:hypothetical protein
MYKLNLFRPNNVPTLKRFSFLAGVAITALKRISLLHLPNR